MEKRKLLALASSFVLLCGCASSETSTSRTTSTIDSIFLVSHLVKKCLLVALQLA